MIPFVTPGDPAWAQARMWDRRTGTTFEEAMANGGAWGVSSAAPTSTGGMFPPDAPNFNAVVRPLDVNAEPTNRTIFVGMRARFSCALQDAPGTVYQWQKLNNTSNWVNFLDATTRDLGFDAARPEDAGLYRLLINQTAGHPVQLLVLSPPQFGGLTYEPSNGAFRFALGAPAAFNYRLEASSDLTNWLYQTTLDNFKGSQQVRDVEAGSFSRRFYRLIIAGP
ncbi:MAG: hypothetical protein DME23_18145 [Verrucomicrobia bacterium]|nr:MAG: hypothetical protein DME23_18145 [Verrucomicrobiota bacterium]